MHRPTTPSTDTTSLTSNPRRLRWAGALALLGVIAVTTTACADDEGSGDLATVRVANFVDPEVTAISVQDDFDVRITVDPMLPQSASITIDDNLLDRGAVSVDDDGVLTIGYDGWTDVEPSRMPVVQLTVKRLESIENDADALITVFGLDADELEVVNTDDGAVTVVGAADLVEVRSTSDGPINLGRLVARRVTLVETDNGPITVHATEVIDGSITGDADVLLLGEPLSDDVELDADGALIAA